MNQRFPLTAAYGIRASYECDSARIHEEITGIPRAKNSSEMSSAIQMLEELLRKYEEHKDKTYDNDLKLQKLYDILLKPIEQQLVLKDSDGSATYESVKRRANNWIMMNSTGREDMELGTMGHGRDNEDNNGGQEGDSSGDLMEPKEGMGKQGKGQHKGCCYQCGHWGHTAKNSELKETVCYNCGQWGHMAKSCTEKGKGKQGKGESKGEHKGKEKRKLLKAVGGV